MIAISSMSAPVKASPLDVVGAVDVVAAAVEVDGPSAGAMAGVLVMPVLGDVQPV
jgi:hypothetical protein